MLQQIHRLLDRRVDGVILWPTVTEAYSEHLEELEARDLPVVTIDHELEFADSVDTDEQPGAQVTAQHLYNLGHRRFGHLAGDQSGAGLSSVNSTSKTRSEDSLTLRW